MDITEIRRRYPHPKIVYDTHDSDIDYCCGGAICLAHAELWAGGEWSFVPHFPSTDGLREMLLKINPTLTRGAAQLWATAITSANDLRKFEDAWARADQALAPHPKETT